MKTKEMYFELIKDNKEKNYEKEKIDDLIFTLNFS